MGLMDIVFENGTREKPKGHAFLFFRNASNPDEVYASYLVLLPINVDVSKYVPPFLMGQVGELGPKDLAAFAFPPVPEDVGSYHAMQKLAGIRDDDLVFCGNLDISDVGTSMMKVTEAVHAYEELYSQYATVLGEKTSDTESESGGVSVNEVIYELMSDSEKLGELTKLVGKLRYAVEGHDSILAEEAESDINLLGQQLADSHQVGRLLTAAKSGGAEGERLTDLFLKRSFHLVHEEYVKMGTVEAEINEIESQSSH